MIKVSKEQSEKEVISWLDYKNFSEEKREAYKSQIDSMVYAVMNGQLVLNDDFSFTHKLNFPIEGETNITELVYKPRLQVKELHRQLSGIKAGDLELRVTAHIAALTGKVKATLQCMDTEDYKISEAISVFFM